MLLKMLKSKFAVLFSISMVLEAGFGYKETSPVLRCELMFCLYVLGMLCALLSLPKNIPKTINRNRALCRFAFVKKFQRSCFD